MMRKRIADSIGLGISKLAFCLGLVAVGLLLAASLGSAATSYPGRNGRIAVSGFHGGRAVIDLVNSRGHIRTLFRGGDREFTASPSWARSGNRIVFSYTNGLPYSHIFLANLKTGKVHEISTGKLDASSPAFFSRGRIAFVGIRYPRGKPHTYVIKRNGNRLHRLFGAPASAISADGRWFISGDSTNKLTLLNAKGKRVRVLADSHTFQYHNPSFSPSGRRIVFHRSRKGVSDLFVVRRNGKHQRRLTRNGKSSFPAFSPDGRRIVFTRGSNVGGSAIVALSFKHPGQRKVLAKVRGARYMYTAWGRRAPRPGKGLGRPAHG